MCNLFYEKKNTTHLIQLLNSGFVFHVWMSQHKSIYFDASPNVSLVIQLNQASQNASVSFRNKGHTAINNLLWMSRTELSRTMKKNCVCLANGIIIMWQLALCVCVRYFVFLHEIGISNSNARQNKVVIWSVSVGGWKSLCKRLLCTEFIDSD